MKYCIGVFISKQKICFELKVMLKILFCSKTMISKRVHICMLETISTKYVS